MVPIALIALLFVGWSVDSALNSGRVARNVTVVGVDVSGLDRDQLEAELSAASQTYSNTPVTIRTADGSVETTAGVIGLELEPDATADAAMAVGRGSFLARPFSWVGGLLGDRTAKASVRLGDGDQARLAELVNAGQPDPVEPTLLLENGEVTWRPGESVEVFDLSSIRDDVLEAARSGANPIEVEAGSLQLSPRRTDDDIAATAASFNELTAAGISVEAGDEVRTLDALEIRSWMQFDESQTSFTLDQELVAPALEELFGPLTSGSSGPPVITVVDGVPRLEDLDAKTCCADDSADRIRDALMARTPNVELELVDAVGTERELLEEYGVFELIGEATTPHDCCQSRVTNIHLFADLMTGVIVEPGESLSLNTHVGRRTIEKGFVESGVIDRGELSTDVGGGISQFATTFFQASFYAGLDIDKYFPHTLWFSRYADFEGRRGIESTISFPEPDLQITNNTPYPILIWPSYTDTSLTVSIYSTVYAMTDVDEQREYFSGQCTVIETDRERSYPDGTSQIDTFRAVYQPRDGIGCDGNPTNPDSVTPEPAPEPKKKKKKKAAVEEPADDGGADAPADDTPADDGGADAPADDTPADDAPADDGGGAAPADDAPADGAAADAAPADDAPADDSGLG